MVAVNGAREDSDRCRLCVPLLKLAVVDPAGELRGDESSVMGVIPNADAAREVGRERRRSVPFWVELVRASGTGRRGEGLVPWYEF
jgi:hypothetical protein